MAYLEADEIYSAYQEACTEADQWRIDYPEYERLADNGLLDDLDENLPEVNDGSLAASLFKLAKRVIRKNLGGRAVCIDRPEDWVTELANIEFKYIMRHANSKASPKRKMKDAVRKAAIFGGQPIVDLILERGSYCGADFIVPYAQDVKLEAGKDSDQDSDIIFWDVYYSKLQLKNMLEDAKEELKDIKLLQQAWTARKAQADAAAQGDPDAEPFEEDEPKPYNTWDLATLQQIIDGEAPEEKRPGNETSKQEQTNSIKKGGCHFFVAFQRGVGAPFTMYYPGKEKVIREWSNPDPTGDIPVHYLYCYQDFINPYGIGIVKLAGGTQNVLDYMRQADVLATQLGLRPPKQIKGDEDEVDEDSLVYAQDANWYVGNAQVERMEMADGVYNQLPGRISMYQASLQKMIPMGDTGISGNTSGDPTVSKTPAGVRLQAANLSIDDEDFAENADECWAMVSRSMINNQFANMQASDFRKLTDDQIERLVKAGFPKDQLDGNELEIIWEQVRATFDVEVDPTTNIITSAQEEFQNMQIAVETVSPQVNYYLGQDGWKFNLGEAYYGMFSKLNLPNLDKIMTKMTDEEKQQAQQAPFPIIDPPQIRLTGQIPTADMPAALERGGIQVDPNNITAEDQVDLGDIYKDPATSPLVKAEIQQKAGLTPDPNGMVQPQPGDPTAPAQPAQPPTAPPRQPAGDAAVQQQIQMVMEQYNVDESTAAAMLEAERQGYQPEEILTALKRHQTTGAAHAAH